MATSLRHITITDFFTENGTYVPKLTVSFQYFGQELHSAPIVLVNHALTGNSEISGENGWWKSLIGNNKCIDTNTFTALSFDIPGNGFSETSELIENYQNFVARDVAKIFIQCLEKLHIKKLFAAIGGSLGGGIAWEMAVLSPKLIAHLIPIASDWKSSDWLIANCFLQERILQNSKKPVEDARIHAMLCYRTPFSLKMKFKRSIHDELKIFNTESWLLHHGEKLQQRFQLAAYKLMNQLLKTIDITRGRGSLEEVMNSVESKIYIISVNSDLFFTATENRETYRRLKAVNANVYYSEIDSVHGHDAFLIEYQQLHHILRNIFRVPETINQQLL